MFIHTGNFLGAILRDTKVSEAFEVILVTSRKSIAFDGVEREMKNEFGDRFKVHEYSYLQLAPDTSYLDTTIRAFYAMRAAAKLSAKKRAGEVTLFYADHFVKLLGIPFMASFFRKLRKKVDGIFFNTRCFRQHDFKNKIHACLVTRGLRTGFFRTMHVLDHGVCAKAREALPPALQTTIVEGVDPWRPLPDSDLGSDGKREEAESGLTLLTFGAHSRRKGTINLLKMIRDFPEETKDYELLIIGVVRDDIREEFDHLIANLPDDGAKVVVKSRFVEEEEMGQFFRKADVALCPYVDFHGSSNVVIRAAAAGLPVVVPPFGFLQDVVAERDLGEIAEKNSPAGILKAIQNIERRLNEDQESFKVACAEYANFHDESRFPASLAAL